MAPSKSESDHIYLLLSILEHTEGKTNWNEIAKVTGLYKDGKFVRQAFNSIKTKYGNATSSAVVPVASNNDTSTTDAAATSGQKANAKKRGRPKDKETATIKRPKIIADRDTGEDELAQDSGLEDAVG